MEFKKRLKMTEMRRQNWLHLEHKGNGGKDSSTSFEHSWNNSLEKW